MTRNVSVTVPTAPGVLGAGVVSGGIVVSLLNAADNSVSQAAPAVKTAPYVANFTGVADGAYIASAQAVDSNGNALGAAVTAAFNVADLTYDAPTGALGVTVS
jgi:uncharacterized protein with FMN-binding domain